jgi:hypothetical protein
MTSLVRHQKCVLIAIAFMSPPAACYARQQEVLLSRASCERCGITVTPVVTLGDSDGPGAIGSISTIDRLADGRYVLSYDEADDELVVFSPEGRFLRRVGRRGNGPGEFQFIRWVRAVGDELHVFDARLRRHTILSSDFRVIRTAPFHGMALGDVAVLNDSVIVMNTVVWSSDRVGYLLHAFDGNGAIIASIAEDPAGYRHDVSDELYWRNLVRASSGSVWSAARTKYRVEEWRIDGTLARTLIRQARWFPDHAGEDVAPDPAKPPLPRLLDFYEDAQGRLWTLVRVADERWAYALSQTPSPAHPEVGRFTIDDLDRAFDTIVEVIDVRNGTLLVSTRLDRAFFNFMSDGQVVSSSNDPDGNPRLHVWRLGIQPLERARPQ